MDRVQQFIGKFADNYGADLDDLPGRPQRRWGTRQRAAHVKLGPIPSCSARKDRHVPLQARKRLRMTRHVRCWREPFWVNTWSEILAERRGAKRLGLPQADALVPRGPHQR